MTSGLICPGRLVNQLLGLGLIEPEAIAHRGVSVVDASRSNPVRFVCVGDEQRFVVKQRGPSLDGSDPLANETAAYRWARAQSDVAAMMPALIDHDDDRLIISAIPGAMTLHEALATPLGGRALAGLLEALATVHDSDPRGATCPAMPWALRLPGSVPAALRDAPGIDDVITAIGRRANIVAAKAAVAQRWADTAVIHGDIKFDNVLVTNTDALDASPHVWLIDWELSGLGLPEWDAAGVLDGLIRPALLECPDAPSNTLVAAGVLRLAPWITARRMDPDLVSACLIARLAQSAVQMVAMAAFGVCDPQPAAIERILDTAEALGAIR